MPFDRASRLQLLQSNAASYSDSALENINREYPHHTWWIPQEPGPIPTHRELHLVFFGSYDWHSCVEMYWVLVSMLKLDPDHTHAQAVRNGIDSLLTPENIETEVAFLSFPNCRNFERPYGWGWLLTLAAELHEWDDADGQRWFATLRPLADLLASQFEDWLPKQTYPIRSGMYNNTAFGLIRSLPFARILAEEGNRSFLENLHATARRWYLADTAYPANYEPSGADFLSAALSEAELMSNVLDCENFATWFDAFLPGWQDSEPAALFQPVTASDHADGQIAHLEGLNLSRAASFLEIAKALSGDAESLVRAAEVHADASLKSVVGSDYMLEHWLSAYATLLLRA